MQKLKLSQVHIYDKRNIWGYWAAGAAIDGWCLTVRFDYKPTKHEARDALLKRWERAHNEKGYVMPNMLMDY